MPRDHRAFIIHPSPVSVVVSKTSLWIARALWIFPLILILLAIYQANVAIDIKTTLEKGQLAQAEVVDAEVSNRADVTYDYISLRAHLSNGTIIEHDKMSLPHTIAKDLEGKTEVEVRVLPDSDQPLVLAALGRAHWRIAAINSAMCVVALVLLSVGIYAWNRFLLKKGDPALSRASVDAVA